MRYIHTKTQLVEAVLRLRSKVTREAARPRVPMSSEAPQQAVAGSGQDQTEYAPPYTATSRNEPDATK